MLREAATRAMGLAVEIVVPDRYVLEAAIRRAYMRDINPNNRARDSNPGDCSRDPKEGIC